MKKLFRIVIAAAVILFVGCAPMSKESYLSQYEDLVKEAGDVFRDCSQSKWASLEKRYEKFSTEYYQKFEHELTGKEKFKIIGLEAKFVGYRSIRDIKDAFSGDDSVGSTVGDTVGDVKAYLEEDFEDDIKDISKDIEKSVKSLSKDLENGVEDISDDVEDAWNEISDAINDAF